MDQIPARSLSNNRTILVVEDEQLMLRLLEKVFLQQGYQVMAVTDGEEAIEVYSYHRSKIDIVLLDVGLPKMTGWQVFSKMQQENPDVRVVIASGYLEPQRKADMTCAGVKDFVNKPYRLDDVVRIVKDVLERSE